MLMLRRWHAICGMYALALAGTAGCSNPAAITPGTGGSCQLSFGETVVADDVGLTVQREPSVAVDSSGVIWIADNHIPDQNAGIRPPAVMRVRRSTDGGNTFQTIGEYCGHENCGNPLLAIDSADRVFLTYAALETTGSNPRWIYRVRIDERSDNPHAAPIVVSDDPDLDSDRPWIAVGPNDEIYVAWKRGFMSPAGEIRISRSDITARNSDRAHWSWRMLVAIVPSIRRSRSTPGAW